MMRKHLREKNLVSQIGSSLTKVKLKSLSIMCILISVLDFCILQCCVGERVGASAASFSPGFRVMFQNSRLKTIFEGNTIANEDEVYITIKMVVCITDM